MKKCIATLASLALVIGLGACLTSLTESFEYDVFLENGLTEIELRGLDGHEEDIDFTTDDTFNDNKDKIKNVDRVEFTMDVYTENGEDAVMDVEFSEPDADSWVMLLEGVPVPGGATDTTPHVILYEDSTAYIKNFSAFQTLAETGAMDLRFTAREGNDEVVITALVIYVAITASS